MERQIIILLIFISCFVALFHPSISSKESSKDELGVYIVLVKDRDGAEVGPQQHTETWHGSLLSTITPNHSSRLVYSYNRIINGFAARLTKSEIGALSLQDWFIRAVPSRTYKLLTTHSPAFLGLRNSRKDPNGVWNTTNMGEGIIIGLLDSGISPGHPSFKDEGLPPPPAKWKGHCDFNASECNNKLIGARSILRASGEVGHVIPFDMFGHGTHVSSTAAGSFVRHAGAFGKFDVAMGTASGVAPRAHIAFYQICHESRDNCQEADILKAIETAVDDGVDVLSMSLDLSHLQEGGDALSTNAISVGAFYAMSHGVFVSCSAGNDGPFFGTVKNDIPWLLTVGASTTDRRISATVELGNGVKIDGETFIQPKVGIKGKIVVCDLDNFGYPLEIEESVSDAMGAGLILTSRKEDGYSLSKDPHILPSSYVSYADGVKIRAYIRSSPKASASFLFEGIVMNFSRSPAIASFSSRGPSNRFPRILKPDILGPGVDILAAYPPTVPLDGPVDYVEFAFMSGTSTSTPHLAGVAALVKKTHPSWSPAAIKSAMMTTSRVIDRSGKQITDERGLPTNFYSMGAGHVDLKRVMDPGLVYDVNPEEYIPFLCGLGITDAEVRTIIYPLPAVKCTQVKKISQEQLNYPSIVAALKFRTEVVIHRTVKNVGDANSTYNARIDVPSGVYARVTPAILSFGKINESKSFTVSFTWNIGNPGYAEGQLSWISTKHVVRSAIVINKALSNGSTLLPYDQKY